VASDFLIYGAYGYTGELTTRHAVERGMRPVLAGRDGLKLQSLGRRFGLEYRAFGVDEPDAMDRALKSVEVVLHCAGPFARTYRQVAEACLRTGTHYLDITGEIPVYQGLHAMDVQAREEGVMLLPGIGLDVVPTDCLSARLKQRMPSARYLSIALGSTGSPSVSRGTAKTFLEGMASPGAVRRDGEITAVPHLSTSRVVDFGHGSVKVPQLVIADVFTAYHSTGIPNIDTYLAFPAAVREILKVVRHLGSITSTRAVRTVMHRLIDLAPSGPSERDRQKTSTLAWAETRDGRGAVAICRARLPESYTFTALSSLAAIERVLGGDARPGYQTPSTAFGADFVAQIEGVELEDVDT
jgi:short subunit dehydrogenase-like uncharacterized protein